MILEHDWLLALGYAFWMGLVPAALLAQPILLTLIRLKSRQTVSQYAPESHQKKQGTPTMGGLIIIAGVLIALGGASTTIRVPMAGAYAFVFGAFGLIGFVDDFVVPRIWAGKRGLGWKQKIAMEFLVAIAAIFIRGGAEGWEPFATVIIILFFSNAYNFVDGLDALAGGVGICFLLGIVGISGLVGYCYSGSIVAMMIIGAIIPFLYLNAPPAKVFMGDVGSLAIGAAMGLMVSDLAFPSFRLGRFDPSSPLYNGRPLPAYVVGHEVVVPIVVLALIVLSLVLAAELIPVPIQIASVKLRKKKVFRSTPIHHGFEAAGWPETRVVWRFILTQLLLAVLAICLVAGPATKPVRNVSMRTAVNR